MNVTQVVKELSQKYPGKNIVRLPANNPSEIICEIQPGLAVAVIDRSVPHYHTKMTETYKVIRGELALVLDGDEQRMKGGEQQVIEPGIIHSASGDSTWVEVTSDPAWTPEDHILT